MAIEEKNYFKFKTFLEKYLAVNIIVERIILKPNPPRHPNRIKETNLFSLSKLFILPSIS